MIKYICDSCQEEFDGVAIERHEFGTMVLQEKGFDFKKKKLNL